MNPDFQPDFPDEDLREDPVRLMEWLRSTFSSSCGGCGAPLCGHQRLHSRAVSGPNGTRCLDCLSQGLKLSAEALAQNLSNYFAKRECYRKAWELIGLEEPDCPWGKNRGPDYAHRLGNTDSPGLFPPEHHGEWDAGDLGCGDLLLPLRGRMRQLNPGQILRLVARDPSAPEDIPAWCGVTGHRLIQAEHPTYWICRRDD